MLTPALAVLIMLGWMAPEGTWRYAAAALGLTRPGLRGWLPAILGPVLIIGIGLWGLAALNVTTLARPVLSGSLFSVAAGLVAAFAFGTLLALGEETGWRGYMLPRLMSFGALPAMLVTGFLQGVWHLPFMLTTEHYHADGNPFVVVPLFLVTLTLAGVFYGWLRLWTGSVWPVAVAHAAVNLAWNISTEVIQNDSVLATEYLGGESGLLMIAGLVICDLLILVWSPVFKRPGRTATRLNRAVGPAS
jgi:membrane protease YdiL (CAAX protease family)